jgi:hypothetical protein
MLDAGGLGMLVFLHNWAFAKLHSAEGCECF